MRFRNANIISFCRLVIFFSKAEKENFRRGATYHTDKTLTMTSVRLLTTAYAGSAPRRNFCVFAWYRAEIHARHQSSLWIKGHALNAERGGLRRHSPLLVPSPSDRNAAQVLQVLPSNMVIAPRRRATIEYRSRYRGRAATGCQSRRNRSAANDGRSRCFASGFGEKSSRSCRTGFQSYRTSK